MADVFPIESFQLITSKCIICDILEGEPWVPIRSIFQEKELPSEILFETENFAIIADIGPIVEGYCLINFKKHVSSLSCLSKENLEELVFVKKKLSVALKKHYGPIIFYEHGANGVPRSAGSCIDHAHLHVVPIGYNLLNLLERNYTFLRIDSHIEIQKLNKNKPYIYYENQNEEKYVSEVDVIPSQFFRRILSFAVNCSIWNWKDFIKQPEINDTKSKIKLLRKKMHYEFSSMP